MESTCVTHDFEPVYDKTSRILILGTLPSVQSRENHFYYGHPRNRFWPLLADLTDRKAPRTIEGKKALLCEEHIAVWDVIASCEIQGSSDSSIRHVEANDIGRVLREADIQAVFANGDKAYQLYQKYCSESTKRDIRRLPSTSPANAAWTMERLKEEWRQCLDFL